MTSRARQTRTMMLFGAVLVVALVVGLRAAPPASASSTPVQVTFAGSGTYTIDQTYQADGGECSTHDVATLTWSATYQTTIEDGVLQPAPGSLAAAIGPGTLNFTIGGICTVNNIVPPCQTTLTQGSTAPNLIVSGDDPQHIQAQSLASGLTAGCAPTDVAFVGRDLFFLNQALPDAATGVIDIPQSQVTGGYSASVSSATAPGQVVAACTGQGPAASTNTSCAASLTWSGTVTIGCANNEIGKVTLSEGPAAPPAGSVICQGQTVKTGPNSRVELTLKDGSIMRLGPNSEAVIDESQLGPGQTSISDQVHLVLGRIWGAIKSTAGHQYDVDDCPPDAIHCEDAAGVRGSAFTASRSSSTGPITFHVIEGVGFFRVGRQEVDFPAGDTLVFNGSRYTLSSVWPVTDQTLVPSDQMPPKLTSVRLGKPANGLLPPLTLRLNQPASISVQILKGKRVVLRYSARGRKGHNSIRPPHRKLAHGRYTLTVTAVSHRRVSLTRLALRI